MARTDCVNAVSCAQVSPSLSGSILCAIVDIIGYTLWASAAVRLSWAPCGVTVRLTTCKSPDSSSSTAPTRCNSVRIAPGGMSPPNRFTREEKEPASPANGRTAGLPLASINSFSECHLCKTSHNGVVRTTRASSPDSILFLSRLTSLRVRPVITATREIFVGRPRSPKSELATSTKAVLPISANSRKPIPKRKRILAIGFRITKKAPKTCL